ncbi:helix-turn-helix domain-containing protein [Agrobacterium tumefaciens]|uniref:helix-turn-helix domain-containing protein n=1 Tax=Agrobacterium tumefaciens TaxID=358 RepID=UPI0021D27D0A|nr:AraC family transcriptional regulator [Agrobacterium tumefaciens]
MPTSFPMPSLRSQMIEARILAPALRISEFRLEANAAHLLILSSGEAEIIRDEAQMTVQASEMIWLPSGGAGRLRLNAGSRGTWLKATEIGLAHAMPTGTSAMAVRETLQRVLKQSLSDKDRRELTNYLETISTEGFQPATGSDSIITSLLSVILIRLCQQAIVNLTSATTSTSSIVERFVLLVAQHKRDQLTVETCAEKLGTSRERLGAAIRKATGLSPQHYIHRELLSEAKDLLVNSSLQVTEIAFRLGFQDPGYFNRFFTRNEGTSPGRFRRNARRAQDKAVQSYAAWP